MTTETARTTEIAPLSYCKSDLPKAIGLSKSTIDAMRARGEFPQPRRLGGRKVGWPVDEIKKWLLERPVVSGTV